VRAERHPDLVALLVALLTSTPTPTGPQDVGWRQPTTTPETQGAWLIGGLSLAAVLAFCVTTVVGDAWYACGEQPPGGGFTLLFGLFPFLTVPIAVAIGLGLLVAHRRRPRERIFVGTALGVVASVVLIIVLVHVRNGVGNYRTLDRNYPTCSEEGVPTWWPSWLPS
jgi:hypothetical protein